MLVQRGFSVEVDGRLGPRTQQALMQFQRREGLQVTGRIDSRTVTSLGVSVRSVQGSGAQQPSTTGQGGSGQGSGAAQQPSQPNQGAGQPQRGPSGQQQGDQSGASSAGQPLPEPVIDHRPGWRLQPEPAGQPGLRRGAGRREQPCRQAGAVEWRRCGGQWQLDAKQSAAEVTEQTTSDSNWLRFGGASFFARHECRAIRSGLLRNLGDAKRVTRLPGMGP